MKYRVQIEEGIFDVDVESDGVRVDGALVEVEWTPPDGIGGGVLTVEGRPSGVSGHRLPDGRWAVQVSGQPFQAEVIDERALLARTVSDAAGGQRGPRPVRAPMPGLVIRIEVGPGQSVKRGDGVAIVEAMKMENELKAEADGVVDAILVNAGQTVEKDQIMIQWRAPEVQ